MTGHVHRLEPRPDWRTAQATALETAALAIDATLAQLADLQVILEDDGSTVSLLITTSELLRTRRNERLDRAARLREQAADALAALPARTTAESDG